MNDRHATTHPGSSEHTKQDKYQKDVHWGMSQSNYRKQKPRQSLERSPDEKNLTYRGSRVSTKADFSSGIMQTRGEWREIVTVERRNTKDVLILLEGEVSF